MPDVLILTTSAGRCRDTYHTNDDCRVAPAEGKRRWIPLAEATGRGLEECSVCSGEADNGGSADPWAVHRELGLIEE